MPWVCPFCSSETKLGYNVCSECQKPRPGSQPGGELTAKPIPKRRRINGTGLESILDFAAGLLLVLGVVGSIGLFVRTGIAAASLTILGTLLGWLLLRSLAEIVRLLKRIVGIDYAGRVSGSYFDTIASCSNCGAMLHSGVACDGCGARLLEPDADEPPQDAASP